MANAALPKIARRTWTRPERTHLSWGCALTAFRAALMLNSFLGLLFSAAILGANLIGSLLRGDEIAFAHVLPQDADIYALDLDRGLQIKLTQHPARDWWPVWSPDGQRLAFLSTRGGSDGLYVMDASGRNVRHVPLPPARQPNWYRYPVWMPDAQRIAVQRVGGNATETLIVNVDDPQQVERLPDAAHDSSSQMAFSARDGQMIFASARSGDSDIYILDAEGMIAGQIERRGWDEWPAWSPDGSRIAFQAYLGNNWEIMLVELSPTGAHTLTNLSQYRGLDVQPAWSPDGSRIAFISARSMFRQVFVVDAAGGAVKRLTFDEVDYGFPSWRP